MLATEKTGGFLEEQKKPHGDYTQEMQLLLQVIEENMRFMINVCIKPSLRSDQRLWAKMRVFCHKWPAKQMLVLFLQKAIVEATSNLSDYLANMTEEDYKILSDPLLNPFEGLQMNKSYSMHVLYNSYTFMVSQSPEDIQNIIKNSKYKGVYKTGVYQSFDTWINLLKLIELPTGFSHKQTLIDYIKSNHSLL